MTDRMTPRLRIQLVAMMFVEYAVWGAWMPILGATLFNRGFAPQDIGYAYAALWLGCIISPFLGGQLVDRFMPSQIFLSISHALAAVAAFIMANQTSSGGVITWMLIWALMFAPSLGITNSIAFHHIGLALSDEAAREREFSRIRTAGSLGWIVAAFILVAWMSITKVDAKAALGAIPELQLTGVLGILMALLSLFLPATPPAKKAADPLAFRRAFALFKLVPGFAMFMVISFVAATEFQFFYVLSAPYLETLHIPHQYIPVVKSISQVTEIAALAFLLPLWLPKMGMRWCLLIGSFAWPIRYLIFAMDAPVWLVVASLGLHGFGYAFVLVVQQLYVDRVAPNDIRGSAQSLLTFITLGLGNWLGSLFCGKVQQHFTDPVTKVTDWTPVFIVPAILTFVCAIAYALTFRSPTTHEEDNDGLGKAELRTVETG
ncbi:MAG: hypothetical protein JWN98_2373 [Abditibacteriota bacterium]|nr:hypothetical protein [Abditibacteriota bacterium]